jgi:hypothetical protein
MSEEQDNRATIGDPQQTGGELYAQAAGDPPPAEGDPPPADDDDVIYDPELQPEGDPPPNLPSGRTVEGDPPPN